MSDHHRDTFITKYIFSQDHKMIAKQFLITGMIMAVIGMLMSAMFRVQLANPGESSILYNLNIVHIYNIVRKFATTNSFYFPNFKIRY